MDTRSRTRIFIPGVIVGLMLLAGCAAGESEAAPTVGPMPTRAAEPSATAVSEDYAVPAPLPGEKSRAVFESDGPDGIPTTTITAVDAVSADENLIIRGACVGDSIGVIVATAESTPRTLIEGAIPCGGTVEPFSYTTDYSGPVQISFTGSDAVTEAWAVVVAD